jgi:hypothetical protein
MRGGHLLIRILIVAGYAALAIFVLLYVQSYSAIDRPPPGG